MYIMETATHLAANVQEIALGLSIIITGMFLLEYRKLAEQQNREQMIDRFLND